MTRKFIFIIFTFKVIGFIFKFSVNAEIAQLVEQLIRNQ